MHPLPHLFPLVLLAGCASTREAPLRAPEVVAFVTYRAGDPLGGAPAPADVEKLELRVEDALAVRGRLHVIDELPGERFEPLTDHVRRIVGDDGADPLSPRALLFTGARLTTGAQAAALARDVATRPPQHAVLAAEFDGLVLSGVTTTLLAAHARPIEVAGEPPTERRLGVELWREDPTGDAVSIALVVTDVVDVVEGLETASPTVARRTRRERLVLDVPIEGPDGPVAVTAPARFDPEGKLAYVLVLEAAAPADDELEELPGRLAAVTAEVRNEATVSAERREQLELAGRLHVIRLRALDGLADEEHRRAALVELAGDVPIAGELALAGDEKLVAQLCERLLARPQELRERTSTEDALAWEVEREALRMLVEQQGREELAPEHAALLLRHTGEAGRHAGTLEDALASRSLLDFRARILEENRIALEDPSPAARVRAHDWLAAQRLEVPGYDPLADGPTRRAALRAWSDPEKAKDSAEPGAAEASGGGR